LSVIRGRVWKYGDDVNTDVIFPGKYTYTVSDPAAMAQHALEDLDSRFSKEVEPGDVIVAGRNWGCGSSREQAVTCLRQSGLGAIVAISFARIYYRNCLNAALPALISPDFVNQSRDKEEIEIDLKAGFIRSERGNYPFPPLPDSLTEIFEAGGLVEYTRQRLRTAE
jgi:3-isopropylmalate/(R)-2-methylmalate dehydratase small subunit